MALPLSGLTMVEAAGPDVPPGLRAAIGLCGRLAADLGANVVSVAGAKDQPKPFLEAGKRIVRAHGADIGGLLSSLVNECDLLVSDMATAALPALQPRRARAVISMDGSPSGDTKNSEFTIEARSGLLHIVGDPDKAPLRLGGHQTAYAAGLAAFTGLAAALCQPVRPGLPRQVRVSLLETAIWLNWKGLAVAQRTGTAPKRAGGNAEWPVVPCADGHVVIVHRMQEWPRLMALVADPAIHGERFQTPAGRRVHRSDLNAILAGHFATLTRADIHALSLRHKLPLGPVWSPHELLDDPQMTARTMFHVVELENGAVSQPRVPAIWHRVAP